MQNFITNFTEKCLGQESKLGPRQGSNNKWETNVIYLQNLWIILRNIVKQSDRIHCCWHCQNKVGKHGFWIMGDIPNASITYKYQKKAWPLFYSSWNIMDALKRICISVKLHGCWHIQNNIKWSNRKIFFHSTDCNFVTAVNNFGTGLISQQLLHFTLFCNLITCHFTVKCWKYSPLHTYDASLIQKKRASNLFFR